MQPGLTFTVALIVLSAVLLAGCGGKPAEQPGTQEQDGGTQPEDALAGSSGTGVTAGASLAQYENNALGIMVKYPASWEKQENAAGTVIFTSPLESATDTYREYMSFAVGKAGGGKASLDNFTDEQLKALGQKVHGLKVIASNPTVFAGLPARDITYTGTVGGFALQARSVWALGNDGRVYVMIYISTPEGYGKHSAAADEALKSFEAFAPTAPSGQPGGENQAAPQQLPGQQSDPNSPYAGPQNIPNDDMAGEWAAYSKAIYDGSGNASYSDDILKEKLLLNADGSWSHGSSNGTWAIGEVQAGDWKAWNTVDYGPKRKLVLDGWNGAKAEGPIELLDGKPLFTWVIYDAAPPEAEKPGQVQLKFGRP